MQSLVQTYFSVDIKLSLVTHLPGQGIEDISVQWTPYFKAQLTWIMTVLSYMLQHLQTDQAYIQISAEAEWNKPHSPKCVVSEKC